MDFPVTSPQNEQRDNVYSILSQPSCVRYTGPGQCICLPTLGVVKGQVEFYTTTQDMAKITSKLVSNALGNIQAGSPIHSGK
jgi:hypothetical protein